jgi:DNA modification methylase
MAAHRIMVGDVRDSLRALDADSIQCAVTSPPYWGLRDYGQPGQLGLERTPDEYVANMVDVFREVHRVLRDDGTLWLNLGDSYAMTTKGSSGKGEKQVTNKGTLIADRSWSIPSGLKPKDLVGIPWRVAFALQADGWYLRSDIIWHKPNPMPESVTDRPTKAHEYLFLLTKRERYFYDADAVREPMARAYEVGCGVGVQFRSGGVDSLTGQDRGGTSQDGLARHIPNPLGRNRRSVWSVATRPYRGAHFAVFPPKLIEPCILAGSRLGDTVLDPFAGSGTALAVALEHGRNAIGCELNPAYVALAEERIAKVQPRLSGVA